MANRLLRFRTICYAVVVLLSTAAVVVTLLSLLRDVPAWWLKVLDFPRVQTLLVLIAGLFLLAGLTRRWTLGPWALLLGLAVTLGFQMYYVMPYTQLVGPAVPAATAASAAGTVRLLQANVLMKNRDSTDLLRIIRQANPDIVLLEETDAWWAQATQTLAQAYPYSLKRPLPNTYGMLLYSKYPLYDTTVRYLQHPRVPSFHALVELPNTRTFWLHAVHPVPPVPSKHPYNKSQPEQEIVKVGRLVNENPPPTLVFGDFNDVAWSNTSQLFEAQGRLRDVRVGRGLYATFDAHNFLLRWPLDHVFVSREFRLVKLARLGPFGSDHFPLYTELTLP